MTRDPEQLNVPRDVYEAVVVASENGEPINLLYSTGTENQVTQRGYRNAYEYLGNDGKFLIGKNIFPRQLPNGRSIVRLTCRGKAPIVVKFGKISVVSEDNAGVVIKPGAGKWYWSIPLERIVLDTALLKASLPKRLKVNERLEAARRKASSAYFAHNSALADDKQIIKLLEEA